MTLFTGGAAAQDDLTVLVTDRFTVEEVQLDTVIVSTLTVEEADSEDSGSYRWRLDIYTYLQIHRTIIYTSIYTQLQRWSLLFTKKLAKHTGLFPGSTPCTPIHQCLTIWNEVYMVLDCAKSMGMKTGKGKVRDRQRAGNYTITTRYRQTYIK